MVHTNYEMMWEPNFMSQVKPDVFSTVDYSSPYPLHPEPPQSYYQYNGQNYSQPDLIPQCSIKTETKSNNYDELANRFEQWKATPVAQWSELDVMYWIMSIAESIGVPFQDVALEKFGGLNGESLLKLNEADFILYDTVYGSLLHSRLQELRPESEPSTNYPEFEDSDSSAEPEREAPPSIKRRPGRPRTSNKHKKKRDQKLGRLWEFIRDLLFNERYCPSFICWDNYEEGKFRFVQSNQVAQLWGTIKGNTKMNYEKFSRAMRYYYKSEIFLPVEGRRLVYQFGPKATGWRTDDPNFQKSKSSSSKPSS